jgi:AAA domain
MEILKTVNAKVNNPAANFTGIYSFGDLLSLPLERPKPAVAGLLFEGQTGMLAGRFSIGKTLLSMQMTLSLASGTQFLGRTIDHPYRVAFLDCENGPSEIQGRLQKQMAALELTETQSALVKHNSFYVNARDFGSSLYGFRFEQGTTATFEEFLNDCHPEIVIVDNLGLVLSGDLEDAADAKRFFEIVHGVKGGCPSVKTFLFLHHIKKPSDHHGGEKCNLYSAPYEYLTQMRGSGRLLDFSEMRYALAEESFGDNKHYVLNGLARSAEVMPIVLEKNDETLSFQLIADKNLLLESLFPENKRPKARELFEQIKIKLPLEFRFGDVEKLRDKDGKLYTKGTIDSTLKLASANGLLRRGDEKKYVRPETLD